MDKMKKSLSLATAELKRQNLRNVLLELHERSSSLFMFSLQWKDLEDYYQSLHSALEKREKEVRELEELVQRRLGYLRGRCYDFEMKRSELGFLDESMKALCKKLEVKECEFDEKMRLAVEVKGREIEEKVKVFEDVKREVAEMLEEVEERERRIECGFEARERELEKKEKELEDLEEYLKIRSRDVELKRSELGVLDESTKVVLRKMETRESEFSEKMSSLLEAKGREVDEKLKVFEVVKREIVEGLKEIKEREGRVEIVFEEKQRGLKEIEKELVELRMKIERRKKEIECRDLELTEHRASISEELESKREELKLVEERMSRQINDLQLKEKNMLSLEASVKRRSEILEGKEKQFDLLLKEFDVQHRWLVSCKKSIENYGREAGPKEDTVEYPLEAEKEKDPQFLSCEDLEKYDSDGRELLALVQASSDPATLVLDALQGSYPLDSLLQDERMDVQAIKKCLLLELLISTPRQITVSAKKVATRLAVEWKAKLKVLREHSLEVLAFLQLLAAYRVSSTYPANELQELLGLVSGYRCINQLRPALGLIEEFRSKKGYVVSLDANSEKQWFERVIHWLHDEPSMKLRQ